MTRPFTRTLTLRVVALLLLLFLVLGGVLLVRTLNRPPDSVIYFVRSEATALGLEPVARRGQGGLEGALRALIAGPNAEERARGLSSAIPEETAVLALTLEGDLVTVDLGATFGEGGGAALMTARLNQLFYTLTQPGEVTRVSLYIGGERVTVFGSEGLLISNPWRRPEGDELPRW
ncbi:MAG: GerMN domain-containing protein [Deinococcota bacterium]|nr:GerMN domain-containing protein [Deinococcota bacterium]